MNDLEQPQQKVEYTPPKLEQHAYALVTGASLPIGTTVLQDEDSL